MYLCLDNLPLHHCNAAKDYCAKVGIELIYMPIYSSSFAPIERLWAIAKRIFRKKLLGLETVRASQ